MSFHLPHTQNIWIVFALAVVAGCTGADGTDGANGANGADGADGADGSSCSVTENADGTSTITCEDGTSVTIEDGADAPTSLIVTTDEAPGANCANGGQRVDHGTDDNGNGTLEAGEIDGSVYICNGEDGTNGTPGTDGQSSLLNITPEPLGGNCQAGGSRLDYGIDDNDNGTLEAGEIDGTHYVCNAPIKISCFIDFAAGWAATGEASNPTTYYGSWGATFVGEYGLIGGDTNGDPGNWNIANEAWGIWSGGFAGSSTAPRQILFDAPAAEVSLDIERAFDDFTATVQGYVNGQLVETFTPSLSGGYDVETVTFTKIIDEIRISTATPLAYAIDDLAYVGDFSCP